jgi:hypothetical protein
VFAHPRRGCNKNAVAALLAGKEVVEAETKSVGCSIKFHPQPAP